MGALRGDGSRPGRQPIAARLFYAQEKAELERLLRDESAARPAGPALYVLRPSLVLGPHAVGAKGQLPAALAPLAPLARYLAGWPGRLRVPVTQWVEAASHPAIMDTSRAKRELGWAPRFTALETLRDTLRPRPQPDSTAGVRIPLRT